MSADVVFNAIISIFATYQMDLRKPANSILGDRGGITGCLVACFMESKYRPYCKFRTWLSTHNSPEMDCCLKVRVLLVKYS